ncbi:MAG: hypothetical protein WAN48_03630 [Actinomycetes bacterium]
MFTRRKALVPLLAVGTLVAVAVTPSSGSALTVLARETVAAHGAWVDVGPMPVRRSDQTMVRLHDGRVLVLGGGNSGDCCCKHAVDLYDPFTDVWAQRAPMPRERCASAVVVLKNGRVMVAGGSGMVKDTGLIRDRRSVEIYHPMTDRWTFTTPMLRKRSGAVAALLPHGRVLVAGGVTFKSGLRSAEVYNPKTAKWRMAPPMAAPHTSSVQLRNGDLLVAGDPSWRTPRVCKAERFVVTRQVWRPAGASKGACIGRMFRLPSGKVLAIGQHKVYRYNPVTLRWRRSVPLPLAVRDVYVGAVVPVYGLPLVLSSRISCHPDRGVGLGYLWRPLQHRWVRWTTMPTPLAGFAALQLADGSILVAGGVSYFRSCIGGDHIPTRAAYRYYATS